MDFESQPGMKILIVRLSAIGDVIHTLPQIELLRRRFPGCSISWVAEEKAADLVRGYPGIDRVIVSRRKQWFRDVRRLRIGPALAQIFSFIRDVRADEFDMVIDFQGLFKSALVVWLARGKRKVGFENARELSTLFYHEKAPAADFHDHAIARHTALVRYLGIDDTGISFARLFSEEDDKRVTRLFTELHIDDSKPLICFHPGALWESKRWSRQNTAGLCELLLKDGACRILLVGGAEEKGFCDEVCSRLNDGAVNLAGMTSLRELANIIFRSDLMISMDSGPMHLSCAVGTPVVALFGPTSPWRTGPFGKNDRVIRKELSCSPCFKRTCPFGHTRCMHDITPEEVLAVCGTYVGSLATHTLPGSDTV